MVGLGSPRTVHIYCPFKVKNRSMRKKHGTVRTAVRPSDSVNHDRFTWSNGLPCFSLKRRRFVPFFPIIWRHLGHSDWITPKRNPQVPHSLNHSLVSASLPRRRRSSAQIAAQPRSQLTLCLSLTLIAAQPSQLTLCLIVIAVVWYNNQFLSIYIFFYVVFWRY